MLNIFKPMAIVVGVLLATVACSTTNVVDQKPKPNNELTAGGLYKKPAPEVIRFCDLKPGSYTEANKAEAFLQTSKMKLPIMYATAGELGIDYVHMDPMSAANKHATAVIDGKRVPVCRMPADEVILYVEQNGQKRPLLAQKCGNKILGYSSKSAVSTTRSSATAAALSCKGKMRPDSSGRKCIRDDSSDRNNDRSSGSRGNESNHEPSNQGGGGGDKTSNTNNGGGESSANPDHNEPANDPSNQGGF